MIANNRVGEEVFAKSSIKFYGGSFILGQHGQVLAQVRWRGGCSCGLGWVAARTRGWVLGGSVRCMQGSRRVFSVPLPFCVSKNLEGFVQCVCDCDVLWLLLLLLQVGVKPEELQHGNMHPAPPPVEGFVTHTFDLDAARTNRAG